MDSVPDVRYARTSDGVTIAYQVFGQGPPVVWLPSLSNLLAQWRIPAMRQAYQQLSRSMTVVLYDGRGTGSSDRRVDLADLGIDAHLRDLDAVLSEAELDSTALLGYYHSVATAIAFAAAEPRRVTRMVLFGGAARMRDAMSPAQTQALLSLVAQDWDLFADSAAQAWLGWDSGETGRLTAAAFRTAAAPATAQAWFTAAASIDVWQLARLTAPATRALAGRRFFPLWAVVHHVGRKSGRELTVPVAVRATPELFIVVLPWGAGDQLGTQRARRPRVRRAVEGCLSSDQPAGGGGPVSCPSLLLALRMGRHPAGLSGSVVSGAASVTWCR